MSEARSGTAVRVALRRVTEVGPSEWAEIRDFGSRYFEGEFIASIQAKRDLVELRGADGRLLGIGAVDLFDCARCTRRSYLSLTRTFRLCWPHRSCPLPAWEAGLYERVGKRLNGDRFDPRTGVAHNRDRRLRPDIAGVPAHLAGDPDIRYFVEHNPGYPHGDLLVCLVPLNLANWIAAASRIAGRLRRRRRRSA